MIVIYVFLLSFFTYSAFQWIDMRSTELALSKLDFELHEVNILLVWLTKRIGFRRTKYVMWLLFATLIGLVDTLFVWNILRFPIVCYLFGLFHLLAAANNVHIYYEAKIVGAENIERHTRYLINELRKQSPWGKIRLLIGLNAFNFFLTIYSMVAMTFSLILLNSLVLTIKEPVSLSLLYLPPLMILVLIMFFPFQVFGSLLITLRRLRSTKENESLPTKDDTQYVNLPTAILRTALERAKDTGAEYVQFSISKNEK